MNRHTEHRDPENTCKSSWRLPVLRYCSVPESSLATAARGSVPACRLSEQLALIRERGWLLLGVTEALNHVYSHSSDRVVALTFDGGLLDFLNAWSVLNDMGAGATLYVPVESVGSRVSRWDRGFSRLGWEQLEWLSEEGVELGIHLIGRYGLDHGRVADKSAVDKGLVESRANTKVSSFCLATKRTRIHPDVRHALTHVGCDTACTLRRGVSRSGEDKFAMPRIPITMNDSGEAVHELIRQDKLSLRSIVERAPRWERTHEPLIDRRRPSDRRPSRAVWPEPL